MLILTFLSKLHSISLMPLQKKQRKRKLSTNKQAPKHSQFFSRPKRACKKQMSLFGTKNVLFLHLILGIPFDVQNQHFIIGHVTVMVSNYVTTPQTASTTILKVSALTLYTLISVCIFSILFSKHLLRCRHGEFV